ncbi:hypothetical protein N0V93_001229 [Gnomoniopsis smithogilvyi]|uniref:Heterokaryon incompatibility domain-containing protein n=1 Tax=Gnomoniopsis smithogilvyi TaxID=1191159 RepID=A0A9W8Z3B8_9PEZI|nr:hypothetical protein N0V93_001229 [Gnomoniopsis smithogilvyi]
MRLTQASKTYLDLPSFYEPPEYSVVICADDDEYAGRAKLLQKFLSSDDPSTAASSGSSGAASTAAAAAAAAAADHDRRCRKLMDISGLTTSVELLEMGPETDQAMLRYQVEYAEAFAFVFSLYSAKTLETAQKLHDKVERGARNHHNIITMSEYEKDGGMTVPVFLIGNRDGDLAPPQEMEDEEDFSPSAFNEKAEAEMKVQRDKAKEIAQLWGCAYFEIDTSKKHGESGIDEAITGIGHFIKATERPTTSSTASFRTPMKPPKQYRIRRLLGRHPNSPEGSTGPKSIRILVDYDDPLGSFSQPGGIRPEPSLLSDTHLRRISNWRRICAQEHSGCPSGEEPRELPTRVIAVNSNDPRYVKLVNTHRGRTAVYACLSYSWGTGTQHCTTTRNIKGHLQRILIADLPQTVADAIKLCRALQIPYIWIDALCIIQDDKDDWSTEAAAMARIYGSSVLTISVPNTSDCTEQFLARSLDSYPNAEVDWIHGPSGTAGTATLVYDWPRDHSSLLSKSPWMERGWTFQEWVLSPRVLHCGSTMTVYECLHGTCYESYADEIEQPFARLDLGNGDGSMDATRSNSLRSPDHANTWPQDSSTARDKTNIMDMDNISRLFERVRRIQNGHTEIQANTLGPSWADVVTQFCGRVLTKDTDKLPALAGLAVRFQTYKNATSPKERRYDYLAGLWWYGSPMLDRPSEVAELPTGLLWRRPGDEFLSRPAAYRAPSWSWAALDGPVEFLGGFLPSASKLQIHDALCIYDYPDSLSSVRTGWIDATGLLRRAWLVKVRDNIDLVVTKDDVEQDGDSGEDKWCVRFDERVSSARWKEMQRFEIFLLVVVKSFSPGTTRVTHHALVLKRVAAEKACLFDCFSRLGTALKNSVSEEGNTKNFENEDEKDTLFQGWAYRKVRLL